MNWKGSITVCIWLAIVKKVNIKDR